MGSILRLACIAVGVTACTGIFDNECGPEMRGTSVIGEVRDNANAVIGKVNVVLTETRGSPFPMALNAGFPGPAYGDPGPLLGHVQHARLLTAAGGTLRDFTVEPGNSMVFILVQTEYVTDAADFQRIRGELLTGHPLVELTTDIVGMETLRVPLTLEYATGWRRSPCT